MKIGAKKTLRKLVTKTRDFLNMTRNETFTSRQLFFEEYSLRPESVVIQKSIEASQTIMRKQPLFHEVFAGHSAFWGHGMYPVTPIAYKSRALNVWAGKDVIVCGRKGGLLFNDGSYDLSSFHFFPWDDTSLSPNIVGPGTLSYDVALALEVTEPVFLGFNGGHTNYAHWLTDHITLLDVYVEYFQPLGIKIVLPDNLTEFAKASVRLMGIHQSDVLTAGGKALLFRDLRFANSFSFNEIPKRFSQAVDRLIGGCGEETVGQNTKKRAESRRLFISRRDATSRPFLNAQELEETMAGLGYEIVVTGHMSLKEQIVCFSKADIIVGAHGAGLINAIFCRPGATLIEIFPEYMVQPHFWTAASLRGLNYGYLAGTSFDPDSASISAANAWASASIAPIRQLKLALSEL
jgi:hypothetical protein